MMHYLTKLAYLFPLLILSCNEDGQDNGGFISVSYTTEETNSSVDKIKITPTVTKIRPEDSKEAPPEVKKFMEDALLEKTK